MLGLLGISIIFLLLFLRNSFFEVINMDEKIVEGVKVYNGLHVLDFNRVFSPERIALTSYVIMDVIFGNLHYGNKDVLALGLQREGNDVRDLSDLFYYGLIGRDVYEPFLKDLGLDSPVKGSAGLDSLVGKPVVGLINKTSGSVEGLVAKNISDYIND